MNLRVSAVLFAVLAAPAAAQPGPSILTQAIGQVDVAPDHAVVDVGAMFTAESATLASGRLADALSAIVEVLVGMGFDRDSLPTTDFTVQPRIDYERNEVTGYDARGSVRVTIRDLEMTGRVIDAVVGAGANQLGALNFLLDNERAARDSALTLALGAARHDAEVLARAAGSRLGSLLEVITSQRPVFGGGVALDEVVVTAGLRQRQSLPVTPRLVTVSVSVSTRWTLQGN